MSVYPGKKRIKGNPRTMRSGFEGNTVMIIIRRMDRTFIAASSFSDFILKRPPFSWQEPRLPIVPTLLKTIIQAWPKGNTTGNYSGVSFCSGS